MNSGALFPIKYSSENNAPLWPTCFTRLQVLAERACELAGDGAIKDNMRMRRTILLTVGWPFDL